MSPSAFSSTLLVALLTLTLNITNALPTEEVAEPVKTEPTRNAFGCTEEEVSEASYAFRNCEDSVKATTFQKQGQADVDLCEVLDHYFDGCRGQLQELVKCKGQDHVDKIKKASITSFANILDSIWSGSTKASECRALKPTTTTTTTPASTASTGLSQLPRTSGAASSFHTSSAVLAFVTSVALLAKW